MKKLTLSKLTIDNFKKIEHLEVNFKEKTIIKGENGVGKTTIFDAFSWLLFGKDSLGATSFDIKFIDKNGVQSQRKEISVSGVINNISIKRVLREKWVKKRGEEIESFEGNETIYEYDGVVKNQSDFKGCIAELIDESIFRLLTSSTYFNSLKWEERRKILYSLIEGVSDLDIAGDDKNFIALVNWLNGKTLELARKELKAKIAPIKKELELLTQEIKGTQKNIASDINVDSLIKERDLLSDPNAANIPIIAKRNEIQNEIQRQKEIRLKEIAKQISDKAKQDSEILQKKQLIVDLQEGVKKCDLKRESLLAEWEIEAKREFSYSQCPNCGVNLVEVLKNLPTDSEIYQTLSEKDAHSVEEFNTLKAKKIQEINTIGSSNNAVKNDFLGQILVAEKWLSEVDVIIVDETPFDDSTLIATMPALKEIDSEAVLKIAAINEKIGFQKATDEQNKKLETSILKQKELASNLASLEKTEFQCEKFARVKSDLFTDKINKLFSFVKFKLFDTQINGGEIECCETIVDGISYSSTLNTGAKVNAGIDIINTLSNFHETFCPVFVDNMESCTSPINVCSQSVFLIAVKGVELTIE